MKRTPAQVTAAQVTGRGFPMQMASWFIFIAATSISVFAPAMAQAQFEGKFSLETEKKAEEKQRSRWSLTEWLAMKERNRLMDLWLAKNSHSSSFEFFLEAGSINTTRLNSTSTTDSLNLNDANVSMAAYAGVAGLRGGFEKSDEGTSSWNASFNLRLFGRAIQDTHFNMEYGLRGFTTDSTLTSPEPFQNQYGGASISIYATKHLGVEGLHRKILPSSSSPNISLEGEDSKATLFIDFGALRVFGSWRKEFYRFGGGTSSEFTESKEGWGGGLRVYF